MSRLSASTAINIPKCFSYLYDHPHRASIGPLLAGLAQVVFKLGSRVPLSPKNTLTSWDNHSIFSKTFENRCKGATWLALSLPLPFPTCRFIPLGLSQRITQQICILFYTSHIINITPQVSTLISPLMIIHCIIHTV